MIKTDHFTLEKVNWAPVAVLNMTARERHLLWQSVLKAYNGDHTIAVHMAGFVRYKAASPRMNLSFYHVDKLCNVLKHENADDKDSPPLPQYAAMLALRTKLKEMEALKNEES